MEITHHSIILYSAWLSMLFPTLHRIIYQTSDYFHIHYQMEWDYTNKDEQHFKDFSAEAFTTINSLQILFAIELNSFTICGCRAEEKCHGKAERMLLSHLSKHLRQNRRRMNRPSLISLNPRFKTSGRVLSVPRHRARTYDGVIRRCRTTLKKTMTQDSCPLSQCFLSSAVMSGKAIEHVTSYNLYVF